MKNQKTLKVNGVDFNAEVVGRYTEEEFVTKQMPLKFSDMGPVERERSLRQVHKLCLEKLNEKPAEEQPVGSALTELPKEGSQPPVDPLAGVKIGTKANEGGKANGKSETEKQ